MERYGNSNLSVPSESENEQDSWRKVSERGERGIYTVQEVDRMDSDVNCADSDYI